MQAFADAVNSGSTDSIDSLVTLNSSLAQEEANFETYMAGSESGLDRHYAMYYYSGALVNVYTFWITRGMTEPAEHVAQIIYDIVKK